ncbi:LOW QUALITY PROTEIN: centriolin [Cottoperca gobio]|uniref:LOW QUALITY PROTEIN: centriolin n=1 Tax=Cottoperca gobio TaxID=56716 RepID=A0A6J2PCF8_COTGO|nr:LOW QUALITY PROTEIN: centriolin-like [Cottoperca gobio]
MSCHSAAGLSDWLGKGFPVLIQREERKRIHKYFSVHEASEGRTDVDVTSAVRRLLDRMSGKQSELEGRLDDMLSRIAMETQEIKELEQQLTDGQILANECLQRDLQGIISGLQEYLRGLREQARRAQQQVLSLQLNLEDSARTHRQELSVQQEEAEALRDRQVELEAELTRQAVADEEKQSRESQLQSTIDTLQDENSSLQHAVHSLQVQHEDTRTQLDQITAAMLDPQELQNGPEDKYRPEDMLSRSVEQLYRAIQQTKTGQEHISTLQARGGAAELQRLRVRNRHAQHKLEVELEQSGVQLQDVQQERDSLLHQLRSQSDGHQRSLGRLNRKLRQLSRSMCDSDQLTAEQLRALAHMVQDTVDKIDGRFHEHTALQCEHTHTLEGLRAELDKAQRHTHRLRQKLDRTRAREGGQWCFIPPGHTAPSLGSLGTQDSGLGLQYLRPPARGGYCVYFPPTHSDSDTAAAEWRDSGGGSDADRSSRGRTPPVPPAPAAAVSAGLADGQTPLVGPAWLLCGSPAGGAALHCNIPEHRDTQGDRCVCECVHKESERLEEEKEKLRLETKQLRHTLRQHRSVTQVCDEVECVEKTLLKRRAELRQVDRLLLEAQSCIRTTRDKQQKSATVSALRDDELKLNTHRAELKQVLQELLIEQQALEGVKTKRTQSLRRLHKKQEQLDKIQEEVERTREELSELQQEVESHRKEVKLQRTELQELQEEKNSLQEEKSSLQESSLQEEKSSLQEEKSRLQEEKSSLQEECKHLEARRRHADRSLSALEEELAALKEEHRRAQLLRQEVVRDTATAQEQLHENSELLSLLSERLEEKKTQLQTVEQAVCVRLDVGASVCQLEDRGRRLTDPQLREELKPQEEEELELNGEGLKQQEEELELNGEGLEEKEELQKTEEEYLRVQFNVFQDESWNTEQEEDRLKARLRCSLWSRQENLRRQETEESLLGLKHRLDQLDTLLTHTESSAAPGLCSPPPEV